MIFQYVGGSFTAFRIDIHWTHDIQPFHQEATCNLGRPLRNNLCRKNHGLTGEPYCGSTVVLHSEPLGHTGSIPNMSVSAHINHP